MQTLKTSQIDDGKSGVGEKKKGQTLVKGPAISRTRFWALAGQKRGS